MLYIFVILNVVGGPENFKLLPGIYFDSGFQKIVLLSYLLFFVFVIKLTFLTASWLPHGQLWGTVEAATSFTRC